MWTSRRFPRGIAVSRFTFRRRVELELEVDVAYAPAERATRFSPGSPEEIEIERVLHGGVPIEVSEAEEAELLAVAAEELRERRRTEEEARAADLVEERRYG